MESVPAPQLGMPGSNFDCDAGPRIVGGNGFLAFNAEFRFPIVGNLGGTVFYDVAQVWKDPEDIRLSFGGTKGMRQGTGVGLRYMTPIGPVRVEYGWPVHARKIDFNVILVDKDGTPVLDPDGKPVVLDSSSSRKEKGTFFFSIGYPF